MLSRLNQISGYDIRLVSVSPSYVKLDQRVSLDPSCTVQKLVESKFPWIKLDANDFTVGYGVCVKRCKRVPPLSAQLPTTPGSSASLQPRNVVREKERQS